MGHAVSVLGFLLLSTVLRSPTAAPRTLTAEDILQICARQVGIPFAPPFRSLTTDEADRFRACAEWYRPYLQDKR